MDIFEEFWLFVRKYLFSILLVMAGILCLITGVKVDSATNFSQSTYFLIASAGLFLLGFMSLFFILKQNISKIVTVILSVVFLLLSYFFINMNVTTVKARITYLEQVKDSKELAKQGLKDIQKIQEAFERKYKKLATSFDELNQFAKFDSIRVLTKAVGDIPSDKMSPAEARSLGYRYPPEVWTEADAIKLGRIVREYSKVPVSQDLFSKEEQEKQNRLYPFDIEKLNVQRTIESDSATKKFKFEVVEIAEAKDTNVYVEVQSIAPYGPQEAYEVKTPLKIGSLTEKHAKPNWGK